MKINSKKIKKKSKETMYINHQKRIDIIYMSKVHMLSVNKIGVLSGHHYHSINGIIQLYNQSGRTNQKSSQINDHKDIQAQNHGEILDLGDMVKTLEYEQEMIN